MKRAYPLSIAVIGFGGRAQGVLSVAIGHQNLFSIAAIADVKPDRRECAKRYHPEAAIFDSGEAFYASGMEVDGIWVISQEKTHADLAVPALERDIPLICEKPLATTIENARRIRDAWLAHPVTVSVPHTLRYLPRYVKAKEIVASGVLGRILHVHAVEQISPYHTVGYYRRGPGMYRSNTTFLLAKCSHDIDIINWMMDGAQAVSVASFGGADYFKSRPEVPERCVKGCPEIATCPFAGTRDFAGKSDQAIAVDGSTLAVADGSLCAWNSGAEQVDHQTVILRYDNGSTADFTLNCFGDEARPLQVTGSLGTLYADRDKVRLVKYYPPSEETFVLPASQDSHGGADEALLLDWAAATANGRKTRSATIQESFEAVKVCVAADIAMREKRVVDMATLEN